MIIWILLTKTKILIFLLIERPLNRDRDNRIQISPNTQLHYDFSATCRKENYAGSRRTGFKGKKGDDRKKRKTPEVLRKREIPSPQNHD